MYTLLLATASGVLGSGRACSCVDPGDVSWLTPGPDALVATDVVPLWQGTWRAEEFVLRSDQGEMVPVEVAWSATTGEIHAATLTPEAGLSPNTTYTVFDGLFSRSFTTNDRTESSEAEPVELDEVCVEVAPWLAGGCTGLSMIVDVPAVGGSYYLAEVTNDSGETMMVYGSSKWLQVYQGLFFANIENPEDWKTLSVRVAAASMAGQLSSWAGPFYVTLPWPEGTACATSAPSRFVDTTGYNHCAQSGPVTPSIAWVSGLAMIWRRRRSTVAARLAQ